MYWSSDTDRYALFVSRYRHVVFMLYPDTDKLYLVIIWDTDKIKQVARASVCICLQIQADMHLRVYGWL